MRATHLHEQLSAPPTVAGFTAIVPLFAGCYRSPQHQPERIFIDDLWGDGFIADKVLERPQGAPADGSQDVPVSRRVALLRLYDYLPVRETWSAANGDYRFDNINRAYEYVVISFDHTNNFRAVLADKVRPAAIGGAGGTGG